MKIRKWVCLSLLLWVFCSVDGNANTTEEIKTKIEGLSLEEKTAQLFIVTPDALTGVDGTDTVGEYTKECFDRIPVGGFVFMENNILSEEQITAMTESLDRLSEERLGFSTFLSVDEEGGTVARIAGSGRFPVENLGDMRELGNLGDPQKAREAGAYIGSYLKQYGFNADFAPVADVVINENNSVVSRRSFGTDPVQVASMVSSFVEGMEENGVKSVLKHFPGHGATEEDSHNGFAYSYRTVEEMESCEWIPFEEGIGAGADFVMVGHISLPNAAKAEVPATMSYEVVTGFLREKLGFDGIVVTDAMNMGAIANYYDSKEAAIRAVEAGCDMILMPMDFQAAYQGILDAVSEGRLSEERIEKSLERILKVKWSMKTK